MTIDFYPINSSKTGELLDSHIFLTEQDIQNLIPFCRKGLKLVDLFVVNYNTLPVAFMSISDNKVEMLFVSPDYFRKGIGQRLVRLAIDEYKIHYIDVNEQNPNALAFFYLKMEFQVLERTETDKLGNPFPNT